jgi:glycosyltransferase involved in cell wall biosynthesis/LmbE family N-acetylglucosaminyl deacetylase
MHICFASLDYPDATRGDGVGTYTQTLGRELVSQGHKVSVIALRSSADVYSTEDEGVQIYWVKCGSLHWYISKIPFLGKILSLPIRELEYSWTILKAIREINMRSSIDIIEGTETGTFGLRLLKPKIKTVIRLHGEAYPSAKHTPPGKITIDVLLSRCLQRSAIRKAHCLIAPSRSHAAEIEGEIGLSSSTVKVINNPLKLEDFVWEKEVVRSKNTRFLFVGRIDKRKGILELLKAIPRVMEKLPSSEFLFAGHLHPTIPEEELEELISHLGIGERVRFLGYVKKDKIHDYYRNSTAVVIPSYYEAFGYIYLEALLHNKPVIAFDISPARSFISNGKNGFLVPVGDVEALAEACLKSVSMTLELPDRSSFEEFNVATVSRGMLALYKQLTADNHLIQESSIEHNIVISPHFDDAVFSCGGIMHEYGKQDRNNLVITLFGGRPDNSALTPLAREIHGKWKVADPISLRMNEDKKALATIGAREIHFDFLDCIYRKTKEGMPLYNDYESIRGTVHLQERGLLGDIYEKVKEIVQRYNPERTQVLAPFGIGNHVDHQIAHEVGLRLIDEGLRVLFYEEFPYSMWYPGQLRAIGDIHGGKLSPLVVSIEMKAKLRMIKNYSSQLYGIGGNYRKASRIFKKYALSVGNGAYAERLWFPTILDKEKEHGDICIEQKV